jgi:cobalt-zinc-cadmium efflux system outer membrane protein
MLQQKNAGPAGVTVFRRRCGRPLLLNIIAALLSTVLMTAAVSAQATPTDTITSPAVQAPAQTFPNAQGRQHITLQSATDLLIARNLLVMAARYNVDILRAQRIAAGLRPNPSLTFSATQFTLPRDVLNPAYVIKTDPNNAAANTTYTLEVDQLVERGGKRGLRFRQADLNTQAAKAQLQDAIRQQIFQLRQAFFTAVLARENLRVVKENLDHFDRSERILFAQVKEGYTAGVDLKREELQRVQFQRDVVTAGLTYQQSLRDVLNLIGSGDAPSSADATQLTSQASYTSPELAANLDVLEGDLQIEPTLLWIDDLRKLALDNRPDVRAAAFALEAAQAGLDLAQAQRVRDVTVGGQYARNGSDNTVGVVLSVPLKIGPRVDAGIAQATAAKLQAEAQLRQARTQAVTDVEKAFTAYQVSRDRLRLYAGGVLRNASDVLRTEEVAYREGSKSLLDYLDAQRTYNQTQLDYNQARYDFLMSLYQLELATGTPLTK